MYNIIKGIYESNDDIIDKIDNIIETYKISKTNKDGYLQLRNDWNLSEDKNWIKLYTLISHSFNNSIRFNSKGEFNMPFGTGVRYFNPKLRNKFQQFRKLIQSKNIYFCNQSFEKLTQNTYISSNDFWYVDPPYLITTASYNENGGWNEDMENLLYTELDRLHSKNCKFALSNVIEHKGKSNNILKQWMKKYNVHYLNYNYNSWNYRSKNTDKPTIEVLITNY